MLKEKINNFTEKVFSDVGIKIKKFAKILFCINLIISIIAIIAGVIFSLFMGFEDSIEYLFIGIGICIVGFPLLLILNYFSTLPLYAFGEIVDNIYSINKKMPGEDSKDKRKKEQIKQHIDKINMLHAEGLITEKEYNDAKASSAVDK